MAVIQGKDLSLYQNIDGVNIPFCHSRNCQLTISQDLIESTTKGSGRSKNYEPGPYTYTLKLSGISILDDRANFFTLQQKVLTGEKMRWAFGDPNNLSAYYAGIALIASVDMDSDFSALSTYTADMQGDGDIMLQQTTVKPVDYTGTGITDTRLDMAVEPWTDSIVFAYDGTNNTQRLNFTPVAMGTAMLNGLVLDPFTEFKYVNNTIVIDPSLLDTNVVYYKIITQYFK